MCVREGENRKKKNRKKKNRKKKKKTKTKREREREREERKKVIVCSLVTCYFVFWKATVKEKKNTHLDSSSSSS